MMMLAKQVLLLRDEQKWQINYESDDSKAQWLLPPGFSVFPQVFTVRYAIFTRAKATIGWRQKSLQRRFWPRKSNHLAQDILNWFWISSNPSFQLMRRMIFWPQQRLALQCIIKNIRRQQQEFCHSKQYARWFFLFFRMEKRPFASLEC